MKKSILLFLPLVLVPLACGDDDSSGTDEATSADTATGAYAPDVDPARFSTTVDNPFLPLRSGGSWVYESTTDEGVERIVVQVTHDTREVMGVETVVVHDVVTLDGEVVEDTYDWYAQDDQGAVWYFGEDTTAYEDGQPSKEGSWEAGVDGAQPGVVMPANPRVGDRYRQEFYEGEAEDMGEVLAIDEQASVPFGSYDDVLLTKDWTPLEPEVVEHKYYARGVGFVLEVMVEGGSGRVELIEMTTG